MAREAAARDGYRLVDIVDPARRTFIDSVETLFLFGNGHYTPAGNAWVARQLLEAIPELRAPPMPR